MPEYAIYEIRNTLSDKLYVGSSKNTKARFSQHRRQLRQGVHHNHHLQRAWNKQVGLGFDFVVVAGCTKDDRWDLEAAHFNRFSRQRLYNHTLVARGGTRTGQTNSPEHRARASASLRGIPAWNRGGTNTWGRKIGDAHIARCLYRIEATHIDGRVRTYLSTVEAASDLGLVRKSVSNILNGWKGQTHTRSGWSFRKVPKE